MKSLALRLVNVGVFVPDDVGVDYWYQDVSDGDLGIVLARKF